MTLSRYLFCTSLSLYATFACLAQYDTSALQARSSHYEKVAEFANRVTVGVYASTAPHMGYYGTGVVISADGYILTSTTVVPEGADEISVLFSNHQRFSASLVEVSGPLESSLLKVDTGSKLDFIPLATGLPVIGERAYTMGNAHDMLRDGEQGSFSVGNISGIYDVVSIDTQSSYAGLAIETDAAINPGQDGGPLLDSSGRLVGIVSLSYSNARWQGVAVPIPSIVDGLKALKDGSVVTSNDAAFSPLPGDGPGARGLSGHARGIANALVGIEVDRDFSPEMMPRLPVDTFLKTVSDFEESDDEAKGLIVSQFYAVDQVLATNQQVRRPAAPVTGLIISADGYILTSTFNVSDDVAWTRGGGEVERRGMTLELEELTAFDEDDYEKIQNEVAAVHVLLPDGRRLEAEIVARNLPTAVALLKVDAKDLPYIDLHTRGARPKIGTPCGVLGFSTGRHRYTLNTGMVSAEDRYRKRRFQFDAIINYGNSGGPVIGSEGEIFGFALAPLHPGPEMGRIYDSSDILRWDIAPNSGVSFAGQVDRILPSLPKMKEGENIMRISGAYIGIAPDNETVLDEVIRLKFVEPGSAGALAGLRKGDQLRRVGGRQVKSWKDVTRIIDTLKPGDKIKVEVTRPGRKRYLEISGRRIGTSKEMKSYMKTLKHGDKFKGRYVDVTDETMTVEVVMGERQ